MDIDRIYLWNGFQYEFFDPLVGYFYKRVIIGKPAAEVTLAWNITATSINAVLSVIAAVAIYMALRPALRKSGLFMTIK